MSKKATRVVEPIGEQILAAQSRGPITAMLSASADHALQRTSWARDERPIAVGGDVAHDDVSHTIDGRSAFARQRDQAEREILLSALREGRGCVRPE